MSDGSAQEKRAFQICRELLGGLSAQWQKVDLDQMERTQAALLLMATATGLIECRLQCKAWTDSAALNAEAFVVGLWLDLSGESVLPDEFRKAFPLWDQKRVAVQVAPVIEARLTSEGLDAQTDVNSTVDRTWLVMSHIVMNPRAATVKLRLIGQTSVPGTSQVPPESDIIVPPASLTSLVKTITKIKDDLHTIRKTIESSPGEKVGASPTDPTEEAAPASNVDPMSNVDTDEESFGGPQRDSYDERVVNWFGKRLYLGDDTQISRLFWLLAEKLGVPHQIGEVQQIVDGMETNREDQGEDAFRKAVNRVRKAISKLRSRLRENDLDDHVMIVKEGPKDFPSYTMLHRFDNS